MNSDVGQDVGLAGTKKFRGQQRVSECFIMSCAGGSNSKGNGDVLNRLNVVGSVNNDFEVAASFDGAGNRETGDDRRGLAGEEGAGGDDSFGIHAVGGYGFV